MPFEFGKNQTTRRCSFPRTEIILESIKSVLSVSN